MGVHSIAAIRGFLIVVLIASRIVRVLVVSGRGEPSLSMTMVQSRLVRTEEVDSLFCWVVGGLPGAVLAAFWAQVCSGGVGRWGGRCAAWWFATGGVAL